MAAKRPTRWRWAIPGFALWGMGFDGMLWSVGRHHWAPMVTVAAFNGSLLVAVVGMGVVGVKGFGQ